MCYPTNLCFFTNRRTIYQKVCSQQLFDKYGVRIALGIGSMRIIDKELGIMDGEAIYLSGRKISEQSTSGKSKAIIKNIFFFISENEQDNQLFNTL